MYMTHSDSGTHRMILVFFLKHTHTTESYSNILYLQETGTLILINCSPLIITMSFPKI